MSLCLWSSTLHTELSCHPQSCYTFLMDRKCMIKWRNILVHGPWGSIVKLFVVEALSLSLSTSVNLISSTSLPLLFPSYVRWQSHISLSFMKLNEASTMPILYWILVVCTWPIYHSLNPPCFTVLFACFSIIIMVILLWNIR